MSYQINIFIYSFYFQACYFPTDKNLTTYTNHYSQDNCVLECKLKKIIKRCGCSPWYQDQVDYKICTEGLFTNCMPNYVFLIYISRIHKLNHFQAASLAIFVKNNTMSMAVSWCNLTKKPLSQNFFRFCPAICEHSFCESWQRVHSESISVL